MTPGLRQNAIALLLLLVGLITPLRATTLVADLDLDEVAITIDFNGESLLLFGAVGGEATSDIIVIKGPDAARLTQKTTGQWDLDEYEHYCLAECAKFLSYFFKSGVR